MNTTLVIMAAGIGSRFGGGVKQLTPVGPNGEIIIDYSIHDALEAGFNKIVFIIRKDIEKDFREVIGDRIEKICDVEYVFQSLDDLPEGFEKPADRTKPWGTGQAVRCCKGVVTAILFSMVGYFNGNNKTVWVMIQGLVQTLLVRLPLAYYMSIQPNASLTKIGLAAPVATVTGIILNVGFFVYLNRAKKTATSPSS